MVRLLKSSDINFNKELENLIAVESKAEMQGDIAITAHKICEDVKARGNEALIEYTNSLDKFDCEKFSDLKVTSEEISKAVENTDKQIINALKKAANRIRSYHERQMPQDLDYVDDEEVRLGNLWRAISHVGIYVPGGLASYPSSVLMNAIPAIVAGCKNITMVVPTQSGKLNNSILAAAHIAGIDNIYKIGGAQAIASLATGATDIAKVDMIVGPGNAYVAAAKKYFSGYVGIDMVAGPSEILVVSDNKNDPKIIAYDLLSQAEHDKNARSILICDDEDFAKNVQEQINHILKNLNRTEITEHSWQNNGAIIIADSIASENCINIINQIATEHLELAIDNDLANKMIPQIYNAGAIFAGRFTPEAIGDYMAGPSHVLPTATTARFSSGLSVYDFLKRVSLIECTKKSFANLANETIALADIEGLECHSLSVSSRLTK